MRTNYPQHRTPLFSYSRVLLIAALSAAYLVSCRLLIGFRIEQLYLVVLFAGCYFSSLPSRKFITGFSIFIVFWIIFDFMKAFPNYRYNAVHLESLYTAEKKLFGVHFNNVLLTPNEYWQGHGNTYLDILAGLCYLCWVPVPIAFAVYLYYKNRNYFLQFSFTFLFVNLLGFALYYLYPAAPPWYVQQHGFTFIAGTHGNTAGLEKFDQFFGIHIFKGLYSKSSNVFAAMPSLHAAYPVVTLFYSVKFTITRLQVPFFFLMAGIWFAAVYTSHHYILDVMAGAGCAVLAIALFQWMSARNRWFRKMLTSYARIIE